MIWWIPVLAVLQFTADIQINRNMNAPQTNPAPTPEPCDCRSRMWNDALSQATHFPDQEYMH